MPDNIDAIRRRAELAALLPELIEGAAAYRWREDVTTLLAEVDRLNQRQGPCVWCSIAEQAYQLEHAELRAEVEQLRAAIRMALQYLTGGGRDYIATLDGGQPAVDTLLDVLETAR